jgi:ACR3 family arsenite transporter
MEIENIAGLIALNDVFKYYFIVFMHIFSSPYFHPILFHTGFEVQVLDKLPGCLDLFVNSFLGIISRYALIPFKGEDWFQNKYHILSHYSYPLLFTIVIMFSRRRIDCSNSYGCSSNHHSTCLYFTLMFVWASWSGILWRADYSKSTASLAYSHSNFNHCSCIGVLASTADKLLLVL